MIDSFFREIHEIDNTVERDKLTNRDLKKRSVLKEFMSAHCMSTHYTFQIRKCVKDGCVCCKKHPPSIPLGVFVGVHFLPSPMLDIGTKYREFDEVYGTETTEQDRPSLQNNGRKGATDEALKHLLVAGKVRGIILCGECHKSRCIYAAKKLSCPEITAVKVVKSSSVYTCGSDLFPVDHQLAATVVVRISISCQSPLEATYYGAVTVHFPAACFYCGESDES